jgi:hypothetical protein
MSLPTIPAGILNTKNLSIRTCNSLDLQRALIHVVPAHIWHWGTPLNVKSTHLVERIAHAGVQSTPGRR